jgi:hypothetical protein
MKWCIDSTLAIECCQSRAKRGVRTTGYVYDLRDNNLENNAMEIALYDESNIAAQFHGAMIFQGKTSWQDLLTEGKILNSFSTHNNFFA